MTIISLLDLPLELPPDVVESRGGLMRTFVDGVPNYLSRCERVPDSRFDYFMLTLLLRSNL